MMFFMEYFYGRKPAELEANVLQKLLEETAEIDLTRDPAIWQDFAFTVNQCFTNIRHDSFVLTVGSNVGSILSKKNCQTGRG